MRPEHDAVGSNERQTGKHHADEVSRDSFLEVVQKALGSISEARLFCSERGYHGELSARLRSLLGERNIWPGEPLVEDEYQKRLKSHGITSRPDIIVHVPFDRGTVPSRLDGNFAVIELKLSASRDEALAPFAKLSKIRRILRYAVAVFVNINASKHYFAECVFRPS